jgi:hypothetical protein
LSSPVSFSLFCFVSLLYSSIIFLFSLVLSFWSSQNVPLSVSLFLFFSKSFSLNKTPSYVPYFVRLCIFSQNLPHLFSFLFFSFSSL